MWIVLMLLLGWSRSAIAQPADCPAVAESSSVLPLSVDLARRRGVPPGLTGQAYLDLPIATGRVLECLEPTPAGPLDILHGSPGDVLRGPSSNNLLRGDGQPVVRMEPLSPAPSRR